MARTKSFKTSIGELAAALRVSHVTAVRVVAGLERRGLLRRTASSWDRRVTLLRLTPAGEALAARLGTWEAALERSLASLPQERRAELEPLLGAVVRSLVGAGAITVAEPCRGCVYFRENVAPGSDEPHRCELIDRSLSERESQLDCPDFTPLAA